MSRLAVILTLAVLGAAATSRADDPFAAAALAPPDTAIYVHVEDAAGLRRNLEGRPLLTWVNHVAGDGQLREAWDDLAARAGVSPERLFDDWLGSSMTWLSRPGSSPDGPSQWALVADVDPDWALALERRLRLRVRGPRGAVGVGEIPEHALLAARDGRTLVIGPRDASKLFAEVVARLSAGGDPTVPSLRSDEAIAEARDLGPGRLAIIVHHDWPLGGWSAVVGEVDGDRVHLRHVSRFANDPISRRATGLTCDFTPLKAFDGKALVAFAEPTDVGDGPLETYVDQRLGLPLIGAELRANLGSRRIVAVGEQEGRLLPVPQDLLAPTVAVCLEVKEPAAAEEQVDRQLESLAARLEHLGQGEFLVDMSDARPACGTEPRCVDVSDATDWFTGGFPIMRNVTLNWTVTHGPDTAWCVIASSRDHLDDVVRCLQSPPPPDPAWRGRLDNAGIAAGRRIAGQLRSWSGRAEAFAPPAETEALRRTLDMISDFADGIDRCRWKMSRPAPRELRLDVELDLAPPASAGKRDGE